MALTYSLYEAKARLSALVRQVRDGARIVITVHGRPVAELHPVAPAPQDLDQRLDHLEAQGVIERPRAPAPIKDLLRPLTSRPGALRRFLDERE